MMIWLSMLCETATKVQNQANTTLPLLKKQYGDTLKSIENLLNAIQQGILTPSTKQRMEELEQQKAELSIQIIKEEMTKPIISAGDIEAYFNRLRKLNFKKVEHRRRLIDTFINKIVLWDDGRIYFGCNYKDCSREMTFAELEEAGILGSDISALGAPYRVFITDLSYGHSIFILYTNKPFSFLRKACSFRCVMDFDVKI